MEIKKIIKELKSLRERYAFYKSELRTIDNAISALEKIDNTNVNLMRQAAAQTFNIKTDVSDFWCDDITFCQETCDWTDCPRNQQNIRDKTIPHSFSIEIPLDCPKGRNNIGRSAK